MGDSVESVIGFIQFLPWLMLLVVMGVCGLIGFFRGLKKTVGSLVVIAVAFILALVGSLIICSPNSGIMESMFSGLAGSMFESMGLGSLAEVDAFATVFKYYVAMIAGPFVFLILFIVFRLILGIIMRIFVKKIPIMNKLPKVASTFGGLGAGVALGFILVVILTAPFLGTINSVMAASAEMVDDAMAAVESADAEGEAAEAVDAAAEFMNFTDKGAFKVVRVLGGDAIYKATSNKRYEGQKVTFQTEMIGLTHLAEGVASLAGDFSSYGEKQANAFGKIADATEESPLISLLSAECISSAAEKWKNGEEFMGVSSLGGNEPLVQPLMNEILDVFATTDGEHLGDDLRSIGAAFGVLNEHSIFSIAGDKDALLDCLNNSPVLSKMAEAVGHDNPRMSGVAYEISNLGMRAFANVVGIPQEGDENYEEYNRMTQTIAQSINDAAGKSIEEKREMVKSNLVSAADDYNANVGGEVADQITDRFIDEFGERDDVTDQEIKDFITRYQSENQVQ